MRGFCFAMLIPKRKFSFIDKRMPVEFKKLFLFLNNFFIMRYGPGGGMVDALDSGSSKALLCGSSSLLLGTL